MGMSELVIALDQRSILPLKVARLRFVTSIIIRRRWVYPIVTFYDVLSWTILYEFTCVVFTTTNEKRLLLLVEWLKRVLP